MTIWKVGYTLVFRFKCLNATKWCYAYGDKSDVINNKTINKWLGLGLYRGYTDQSASIQLY